MASSGDAVATGLVPSLARPGGNITGLTSLTAELAGKRLEILHEIVPKLTRVGVLWFSGGPGISQRLQLKEIQGAALGLNLKLEEIEVEPKSLESAFQSAKRKQGQRYYHSLLSCGFRRKKTDRRTCWQIPVTSSIF